MADSDSDDFTQPGVAERIRKGLIEQGREPPTGYTPGAYLRKLVGEKRLDRAIIETHGGGRIDEHGIVYCDPAPGRAVLAEMAADSFRGVETSATKAYQRIARTPLGKIVSSVTPPQEAQRSGPPHRPAPIATRPDWRPSGPPPPQKLRSRLYVLRDAVRRLGRKTGKTKEGHDVSRIAVCGRAVIADAVGVVVSTETGRAGLRGVARCGSVWECPVCMTAIAAGRAEECRFVVEDWHGLDRASTWTLTVRHMAGADLRTLRSRLADAWRGFCRGAAWNRLKARWGIVGSIRAMEITHGPNGWHPHLHLVMLHKEKLAEADLLQTRERGQARQWIPPEIGDLIDRWRRMVWRYVTVPTWRERLSSSERRAIAEEAGVDLEVVEAIIRGRFAVGRYHEARELAVFEAGQRLKLDPHTPDETHGLKIFETLKGDYLAKLGLELATSAAKSARKPGHHTPLQLAGLWADQRSPQAGRLWQEYCAGMMGARQLTWSRGLKQAAGLRDRNDLELAEHEDPGPTAECVGVIDKRDWSKIQGRAVVEKGRRHPAVPWILGQVETHGAPALASAVLRAAEGPVWAPAARLAAAS